MNDQIYEAPKSETVDEATLVPPKPGIILIMLLVLFTLLTISITFLNSFLSMAAFSNIQPDGFIPYLIGGAITPLLIGCIIVGLFQIGKRFRNSRSRCKIFLWCQVLFFLSGVSNFLKSIAQGMAF